MPPVAIGERMRGGSISRVLASKSSKVKEGDLVNANHGWTEVAIVSDQACQVINVPKGAKVTDALGVLGNFKGSLIARGFMLAMHRGERVLN